jgi:SAM-dependent methyltransferase
MNNPWLTMPLEDYEGHVAMREVGQAKMLSNEFEELLKTYAPTSAPLIGCAGGNGFEEALKTSLTRLVGLDINPTYIADAKARYAGRMLGLELYCADIEGDIPALWPVRMVYAALVFEYVDLAKALKNLRGLCQSNGILAALVQLPKEGAASVTESRLLRNETRFCLPDIGGVFGDCPVRRELARTRNIQDRHTRPGVGGPI